MKTTTLGKVADLKNGRAFKKSEWSTKGLPIIRITNLNDSTAEFNYYDGPYDPSIEINGGDLLFSWSGTVGTSFGPHIWKRGKAVLNQHIYKVNVDTEIIDRDYLYYYLRQVTADIEKHTHGAGGLVHVTKKQLESTPIPIPPLSEQRNIVEKLERYFEKIDLAIEYSKTNIKNCKSLFEDYLDRVYETEHEDWTKTNLGNVCDFQGGSQPPKSTFSYTKREGDIRLLQIRDYKSDKNIVYIPKSLARRFCTKQDVMIGRYGPPVFQILRGLEGAYNVALMKAIPREDKLTSDFLFWFLKNRKIQGYVTNLSNRAAGQSGLNKQTIEPYPIRYPNLEVQSKITRSIERQNVITNELAKKYKAKQHALEQLKQSLLFGAFKESTVE